MSEIIIPVAALILIWASYSVLSWIIARKIDPATAPKSPSINAALAFGLAVIIVHIYSAVASDSDAFIERFNHDTAILTLWACCNIVSVILICLWVPARFDLAAEVALNMARGVAIFAALLLILKLATGNVNPQFDTLPLVRQLFYFFRIALFLVVAGSVFVLERTMEDRPRIARHALQTVVFFLVVYIVGMIYLRLTYTTFYSGKAFQFMDDIRLTMGVVLTVCMGILGYIIRSETLPPVPAWLRRLLIVNTALLLVFGPLSALITRVLNVSLTGIGTFIGEIGLAIVTTITTVFVERVFFKGSGT